MDPRRQGSRRPPLSEGDPRRTALLHHRRRVEDFEDEFGVKFTEEERDDVDSVGGLLAKHLGRVPIAGNSIELAGWRFTAERPAGRRHRITSVLATKLDSQDTQIAGE